MGKSMASVYLGPAGSVPLRSRAVFFAVDKFVTSCEAAFHAILSPPLRGWAEKEAAIIHQKTIERTDHEHYHPIAG